MFWGKELRLTEAGDECSASGYICSFVFGVFG